MPVPQKLKGRYEIREVLGQGGMGVVYRAHDDVVNRDVALKTLRDAPTRQALELFLKECNVLASLSHPNIIEIFDIGEYDEDGKSKPFFVMPLLPGVTLDRLIKAASHRLTVERVVDIICQTCRGLHSAHERGLVHRDMKPSNLFIMDDDSVKIIDFGVAHMVEQGHSVGMKGTLLYMAPEQLQMKPASAASDIFSLGVVAYEALTRRRPFEGTREAEIAEAIMRWMPPPASDLNPAVSQSLSRVIHKAMAKQPWSRYSTAREFADTLQKALRNESIEFFSPARIQPRIERANAAFESGDLQFAAEILTELEAEGHFDPGMATLRRQIELASRTRTINQLLDSARKRFESDEHPLALHKIQEILQLDPGNAQALGLKASIENKLVSQKFDEWHKLARQHLENKSFSMARDAVQNMLQVRPGDARAAQLTAEIDRREQEFVALRKQKQELYQRALEAWNAGEVSSALSKLEQVLDLDKSSPDTSAPGQTESYQQFYNKVRSEHESMKNSYAEAKKLLDDRNFPAALAITNEWLAKHPGHALFQALKFDIEERQRQELSAEIAAIDRDLDSEPDLDRKVNLLEQALASIPGEPHFERQLKPLREKRDLVNSIAAKARWHEERGQFPEALAQWEILKTIYSQYPGLTFEIERVVKRRDTQARTDAKARWVAQIERAMEAAEFDRAAELALSAEAEFPGDAELEQMKQAAKESGAKAAEAAKLLAQGKALCAQQWFDEGLQTMRKAYDLDPRNAVMKATLIDTLIERARVLLDTDWRASEPFIQQALELDPNNALAKSLRTTAADHKRDETVIRCFTQARQYRASGQLEEALREAEECYAQYPLDPRLQQLRDILKAEIDKSAKNKHRPMDLEAMRFLEQSAVASISAAEVELFAGKAREIAAQYPDDQDFQGLLSTIERRLKELAPPPVKPVDAAAAAVASASPATRPGPPSATSAFTAAGSSILGPPAAPPEPAFPDDFLSAPTMQTAEPPPHPAPVQPPAAAVPPVVPATAPPVPQAATPPTTQPPAPPIAQPPAPKPAKPPAGPKPGGPKKPLNRTVIVAIAAAFAVIVIVSAVLIALKMRGGSAGPGAIGVEVRTTPPGATIRVGGKVRGTSNFRLEVPPGVYQIEALLEGYQPAAAALNAQPGAAPLELALSPLPAGIRLYTDLAEGKVTLNDQAPRDLQEGQALLDSIAPGSYTLKVTSKAGEAAFAIDIAPGRAPSATAPPTVKNVIAMVVANLGSNARVYTSLSPAKVSVDGQEIGEAGPQGLELQSLSAGTHEIAVSDGKNQVKKTVEISAAPALTAFLQSDQNIGTLLVMAGEDGVDVFIDGKRYRRQTARGGQLRIPREPKEYRVRVAKAGFQEAPEQVVRLAKGEEKKLVFALAPLPTTAHLAFRGATPGAQVFLDGNLLGTVQPDGSFTAGSVAPGEHTIELRSGRLRSRPIRRTFGAGQTVEPPTAEIAMRANAGTLRLSVSPAGAQVTVTRANGQAVPLSGATVELDEGAYTVSARAQGHTPRTEQVQITGGQTATVTIALVKEAVAAPKAAAGGMEGWDKPWSADGSWFVRRGGGLVLYKGSSPGGAYAFNIMLAAGGVFGKELEWVANWQDPKNYLLYRLDKENFRRFIVANGRRTEALKQPHGIKMGNQVLAGVQIEADSDSVVHRIRRGDQWVVIDNYGKPGVPGRFGIQIQGNDEVRISGFSYYPKD